MDAMIVGLEKGMLILVHHLELVGFDKNHQKGNF